MARSDLAAAGRNSRHDRFENIRDVVVEIAGHLVEATGRLGFRSLEIIRASDIGPREEVELDLGLGS
jgi:hypothetical protein